MSSSCSRHLPFTLALLFCALLAFSCTDSDPNDSRSSAGTGIVSADDMNAAGDDDGVEGEGTTNSSMPDPLVQNTTVVEFDITVPAYVSDALEVRVTWSDFAIAAEWVGDELWSATANLPG